jgi:cell division protein FtsL
MTRVGMLLVAAVVTSALGVVSAQHQSRKLYSEFEREQARAHQLEVEWGQLQLEQSTWASLARVEAIARERLGLSEPSPGRILVVGEAQ